RRMREQVPDHDEIAWMDGGEAVSIRGKGEVEETLRFAVAKGQSLLPRDGVEELECWPPAVESERQLRAIGAKGDGTHLARIWPEPSMDFARVHVPDTRPSIARPRDEIAPVRREGQRLHSSQRVLAPAHFFPARDGIPQTHRGVESTRR